MAKGMTHGVLRKWLVRTGDRVSIGQVLYELDVGGATIEVVSLDLGVITVAAGEGSRVPVGRVIGFIEFTEEERIDYEHFAVALTHKMRTLIDQERGDLSRAAWLRSAFQEFVRNRLESSEPGGDGDT